MLPLLSVYSDTVSLWLLRSGGQCNRRGVFSRPRQAEKSRCSTHSSFHFSFRSIPFLLLIFPPHPHLRTNHRNILVTLSIGTVGTGYVLERRGYAWFCTLLRNNFQKARPFLHFYFLSNENSFLVFTDHKGKQSVWFTCLEFRPRSNLFFYLSKTAQTPACYCRFQASTFPGSIFLF